MTESTHPHVYPLHRLEAFERLAPAERCLIEGVAEKPTQFDRLDVLQEQGVEQRFVHILVSGWVASSVLLADGSQQIVRLHLPGDVLGLPSLALRVTAECLTALTPVAAARVPLQALGTLFEAGPRLASLLFLMAQRECVALMDALTSVGCTLAVSRVAAFLLDISDRIVEAGQGDGQSFELPLTQDQFGHLVGLSTVHVNRSIHHVRDAKLVAWKNRQVTILDRPGLRALALRTQRVPSHSPAWLPGSAAPLAD